MIIDGVEELTSGARLFVDSGASVLIKYHDDTTPVDFSDAPTITRADGLVSFDSELGTTKEKCSISSIDDGKESKVRFISVEATV